MHIHITCIIDIKAHCYQKFYKSKIYCVDVLQYLVVKGATGILREHTNS